MTVPPPGRAFDAVGTAPDPHTACIQLFVDLDHDTAAPRDAAS